MFIRVASSAQNASAGNQYKFEFWSCEDGVEGEPQEYESTRISSGGEYIATSVHTFGEGGIGDQYSPGIFKKSRIGLWFSIRSEIGPRSSEAVSRVRKGRGFLDLQSQ